MNTSSKHRGIWFAQYSIRRLPVNFRKSVNMAFSASGVKLPQELGPSGNSEPVSSEMTEPRVRADEVL